MTKTRDLADLANGVTSANIVDGTLVNNDVNASAGIVSSKLNFTQSGTGATQRTVKSKLQDVVSVKDFGAVGDGTTDDTAAIQAVIDNHDYVVFPPGYYAVTSLTFDRNGQHVDFNNAYLKGIATTATSSVAEFKATQSRYNNLKVYGNYNVNYTAAANITADAADDYAGRCTWTNLAIYGAKIGVLYGKTSSPVDAPVSENHIIGGEFRDVERCFYFNQPNGFLYVTGMVVDCQRYEWEIIAPGEFTYSVSNAAELVEGWLQFNNCEFLKGQSTDGFLFVNGSSTDAGELIITGCHTESACTNFYGYNGAKFNVNGFYNNYFNNSTEAFIKVAPGSSGEFIGNNIYYRRSTYTAAVGLIDTTTAEGWQFIFTNCEFKEQNMQTLLDSDSGYSTLCDVRFTNCFTNDSNYGRRLLKTTTNTIAPALLTLPVSGVGSAPPAAQYQALVGGTSILVQTDSGPTHNQCIEMIAGAGLNQLYTFPVSGANTPYEQKSGILEWWQKAIAGANGFNGSIIVYYYDSGTFLGFLTLSSGYAGNIPNGNTAGIDWKKNQVALPHIYPAATDFAVEFRQGANSQTWRIAGIRIY